MGGRLHQTVVLLAVASVGSGCPFLFAPPDLSNVDRPADTDTDTDTDTDSDTDTDTDVDTELPTVDTGPDPDAPSVLSLEVAPHLGHVTVLFSVADAQQDFAGGFLVVGNGTIEQTLQIPGDLPDFNANGVNRISVARDLGWFGCDLPVSETWTFEITDLGGHTSRVESFDLVVEPMILPETGNMPHDPWVGLVPPFVACVSKSSDPEDPAPTLAQLQTDIEAIRFTLPAGTFRTELGWTSRLGMWFSVATRPFEYPYLCDIFPSGSRPDAVGCTFASPGADYVVDPYVYSWDNSQYPVDFQLLFVASAD